MKALASLMIIAGISIACTSTGTERKGSVPVGVSDTIAAKAPADKGKQAPAASMTSDRRAKGGTLNLAFVGDIMPGTTFPDSRLPEKDGATLFKDVDSILTAADVAAGNMEGALADEGETTKKGGKFSYSFRVPTRYGKLIADAGFDFMSMANNHAFDFGLDGVKSTEATLHSNGIAYSGIGGRKESAIVERNGIRYGFCAFGHNSYTLKHADQENVKRIIGNLREKADIVIVSFHGGAEGTAHKHLPQGKEMFLGENRGDLRNFAHFCIDNGADVVYGHGPHVVRAVELYKNHFIAYSLGNFCTPYGVNISGISGYAPVLQLTVNAADGTFVGGKINSFIQQRGKGPRHDPLNLVAKEIRSLTNADFSNPKLTIANDGTISKR
ncbi:CapA family protein [Prevotella sp. LMAG:51]|uniref:CapA family protein n=1 Tax=Prevotella sp. LMAG:51 TaxID=1969564 RepID=UPI00258030D7|nr:CapA family protein [Prevotella sp. LMAG:51]